MAESIDTRAELLNQLADEFAARQRNGERPGLEEYCARYPDLAEDLRDLFPALIELECARADSDPEPAADLATSPPVPRLDDFHLLREVGRGGMGVVYEAEQVSLGRRVAIKLLPGTVFRDPVKRRRFEREARAAARLHHTNIVPVHGFGEHDGTPYYVMQFIPGLGLDAVIDELRRLPTDGLGPAPSLSRADGQTALSVALARSLLGEDGAGDRIRAADDTPAVTEAAGSRLDPAPSSRPDRGPPVSGTTSGVRLPGQSGAGVVGSGGKRSTYWESVARVGVQVAGALAYAHKQGVLHRDVKPGNLLLDLNGIVWVTDFGLAKADDSDDLTHTGDLIGTLRYMPPEAFDGKADARGDIYALGLTLFELVALRPAYEGGDRKQVIRQVTTGTPPPLRRLRPDAPRDLVTVVEKAIDRDPARRYQTAGALADDLQRFLDGRPIAARPVGRPERAVKWVRRNPVVTGAAAAVILALAAGTTVSYVKYRDAERQKGVALQEAAKAGKARDFLVSIFQLPGQDVRGGNITARQILADAERRIPVEFADQPELRRELEAAVGQVKRGLGRQVPQAMILEVRGAVGLRSAAGADRPAAPQGLVYLDDRLTPAADAHLRLVFLSDFHTEVLRPGREATVDRTGCEPADAVLGRGGSVLMTFVRLPKGTFYMGWGGEKGGVKTEIIEDFEIAVHAVTQGQWEAVTGTNPSHHSATRTGAGKDVSDEELRLFPVENVSWNDAQEFLRRLNDMERGRGYRYRLPTEAEWEYACRGGATSEADCSYHFYFARPANDLSAAEANFNGENPFGNAPKRPYLARPTRVGAFPPNRLGLCDMHGNVWQFCADPLGPHRVIKGGCWNDPGSLLRAGHRSGVAPEYQNICIGLRVVRVADQ